MKQKKAHRGKGDGITRLVRHEMPFHIEKKMHLNLQNDYRIEEVRKKNTRGECCKT